MSKKLTVQEIIFTLEKYWADQGCMLMQAYDNEKGAGTMSPYTFLRAIGPEPWNVAYVEPSRRPADGRYGENPNRLYQHHQFQVLMQPSPDNIQELYLGSLKQLGIEPTEDEKFELPSEVKNFLKWRKENYPDSTPMDPETLISLGEDEAGQWLREHRDEVIEYAKVTYKEFCDKNPKYKETLHLSVWISSMVDDYPSP